MAEGSRHQPRHTQQIKPQAALQLRQKILQEAPPHRERILPSQRLSAHRHPLRQTRKKLPCFRLPRRCYRMVDFMSLGPGFFNPFVRADIRLLTGGSGVD